MPTIDPVKKEINCKIVYYGPGLGGKTTNFEYIHSKIDPRLKGTLVSLRTQTERTLFFDFLPIFLGTIQGMRIRMHYYTVPGQSFYNRTRRAILQHVDGIVFVADSQRSRLEANIDSLENMIDNLSSYNYDYKKIPTVMQYNKRDLVDILPVIELREHINKMNWPEFEAVAIAGKGVMETLKGIIKLVVLEIQKRF